MSVMPTWTEDRKRPGSARQRQCTIGTGHPALRHCPQAGPPGRDDRELCHGQQAIDKNEDDDDQQLEVKHLASLAVR